MGRFLILSRLVTSLLASPWRGLAHRPPWVLEAVFLAHLVAFGALAAVTLADPWNAPAEPVERIEIAGLGIETGQPRPPALMRLLRERLHAPIELKAPGLSFQTTWAALGAEVDLPVIEHALVDLARPESPATRYARRGTDRPGVVSIPLPATLTTARAVEALVAIKESLDEPPVDARFDVAQGRIRDEKPGRSLDVYASLGRLDAALGSGASSIELVVESRPPQVRREDLAGIDVHEVVGFFETPISRMVKDRERTHNVKHAVGMLDGVVLLPGKVFSLNEVVGDRTEARGFRYAPVIAGGVLVEGMGGGTCQVASTLYAASFFAGLITVERQPHSRPSSYIKLGLDATVSYPNLDLKLENPFDFPLVIHYFVDMQRGLVRAEFRGRERPYTVTFLRKILATTPFPVRTIDDPAVLRGQEVVTQIGTPGFLVRRYQVIERDKVGYRHQTTDKYPPTARIIRRGVGDAATVQAAAEVPKPDTHPPYEASEFLRMVQGPGGLWYESSHD